MNIGIILSGGVGSRMGANIPKQYIEVDGKPIIQYCLETFLKSDDISFIVIGVADSWKHFVVDMMESIKPIKPIYYSKSGETRQDSIYYALCESQRQGAKDEDIVIIHDAARPLVSIDLVRKCLEGCKEADGVLPVIPVKDTIYRSLDGIHITSLLTRNELFAGQAPEAFLFGKYFRLHQEISCEELKKINGSTEIAYKGGLQVKLIEGDLMNFKITTPEDLSNFISIINKHNKE